MSSKFDGAKGPPAIEGMTSLKVDNLTYRTTIEDLERYFKKYGDIGDIYIPRDQNTRESRGFAFVRFFSERDADDAMDSMDGKVIDGREIRVALARYGRPSNQYDPRRSSSGGGSGGGGGRYRGGRDYDRGRDSYRDRRRSPRRRRSRSRSRSPARRGRSYSRSPPRFHKRSASRSPARQSKSPSKSKSRSRSPQRSLTKSRSRSLSRDR